MIESVKCLAPREVSGERFDVAAARLFPDLSRKIIKSIIDAGGAYLNKKRIVMAKHEIKVGDTLELFWESKEKKSLLAQGEPPAKRGSLVESDVVFCSKDFLIVNKPAGLPSQATLVSSTDTVLHALHELSPKEFPLQSLFLVHRLDKDTSGLLIVARNQKSRNLLEEKFRDRAIKKTYLALTLAIPAKPKGEITLPIAKRKGVSNAYFAVTQPGRAQSLQAKPAKTAYEVLQAFDTDQVAWLRCFPETGRTHQIRVHLQAIGCPLLGDKTYSNNIIGHAFSSKALRHMLHAETLEFTWTDGMVHRFVSPVPPDFQRCLDELRKKA